MILYMMVSNDKYELPLCVCDTAHELARKVGLSENYVYNAVWKGRHGLRKSRIIRVDVDERLDE